MDSQYFRKYRPSFRFSLKNLLGNKNLLIILLVGIPVLSFIAFSPRGVFKRMSLESQKAELVSRVGELEAEQARLLRESRDLDHDLRVIEGIARERGMIYPGETVYIVRNAE
jgi:cell division protein FtsB